MKTSKTISILEDFQKYRMGKPPYDTTSPIKHLNARELGIALDEAISLLKQL